MNSELIGDLKQLIKFQTVAGNKSAVVKLYDFVTTRLERLGMKCKRLRHKGVESLVAARRSLKKPKVLLQAHVDVVPGPDYLFQPRISGRRLYGRGASDMKFAVAVYLDLFNRWNKEGILDELDVGIMLTSDEEVGGFNGTGWLIKQGYLPKVVFLPDGGDNWQVVAEEKGLSHIRLTASGVGDHGSRPWLGDNAGDKLIRIYQRLQSAFKCSGPDNHWHNTINLGRMKGGDATNKVMDKAVFDLDIRYTADYTQADIKKLVKQAIRAESGVEITELISGPPFRVTADNPYIKVCLQQMQAVGVLKPCMVREHGASDARFWAQVKVPVVMVKPFCSRSHVDDEWVDIKDLGRYLNMIDGWVKQVVLLDA